MTSVWPAMDRDALRACPVVLAATWNTTAPVPVPEAPLTTMTQFALLVALHAQPFDVLTVTVPVPPVVLIDSFDCERENVHACAGEPVVVAPPVVLDTETHGDASPP